MLLSARSCSLPLLMALLVVAAAVSLGTVTASKNPHSAHMRHHRDGNVGAAACTGLSLSQLPSLPLPNYNVPASIERNLTDGGRTDVHGWLMLPWDRPASTPDSVPISAWFYHHTPEFFTESPHDFLLLIAAELTLTNQSVVSSLPFPPAVPLLGTEYVFTPPAFSLDQLILSSVMPAGTLSNGSFDTPQRYPLSPGRLSISTLPTMRTVHYLNQSTPCTYDKPVYLSYPRAMASASAAAGEGARDSLPSDEPIHLYLIHLVYASPDYDQALHISVDPASCVSSSASVTVSPSLLSAVGATWLFPALSGPDVLQRAVPSDAAQPIVLQLDGGAQVKCGALVLEEVHCVVMPDSFANCPPTTEQKQKQQLQRGL